MTPTGSSSGATPTPRAPSPSLFPVLPPAVAATGPLVLPVQQQQGAAADGAAWQGHAAVALTAWQVWERLVAKGLAEEMMAAIGYVYVYAWDGGGGICRIGRTRSNINTHEHIQGRLQGQARDAQQVGATT